MTRRRSNVATLIKTERQRRGLPLRALGRMADVSAVQICDVENDRRTLSAAAALRLGRRLGLLEEMRRAWLLDNADRAQAAWDDAVDEVKW